MTVIAKPIVQGSLWLVEENGEKVATLRKNNHKFLLSTRQGERLFNNTDDLINTFGKDFFAKPLEGPKTVSNMSVCGYPAKHVPFEPVFDLKNRLPLYTKSKNSKSFFCAGYYGIKFSKNWVKVFCPKLVTVLEYEYCGPFHTEDQLKEAINDARST